MIFFTSTETDDPIDNVYIGNPEMPGLCPQCEKYLTECTRPGVLECPEFETKIRKEIES